MVVRGRGCCSAAAEVARIALSRGLRGIGRGQVSMLGFWEASVGVFVEGRGVCAGRRRTRRGVFQGLQCGGWRPRSWSAALVAAVVVRRGLTVSGCTGGRGRFEVGGFLTGREGVVRRGRCGVSEVFFSGRGRDGWLSWGRLGELGWSLGRAGSREVPGA